MNLQTTVNHLLRKVCSLRFLTLVLVWIYMLDVHLSTFRQIGISLGVRDTFAVLPFLQTRLYFNNVMLLGAMCFFSNAPFMERAEMYVVTRIGRRRWGQRNILFIFLSSSLLSVLLAILSIVLILPVVNFKNSWGSLYHTLFAQKDFSPVGFLIEGKAMRAYSPSTLLLYIMVINTLAFALIGMLLYTLCLYIPQVWGYFFTVALIFLASMINYIRYLPVPIDYFSPFTWITVNHWRYGYDLAHPNLIYIFTAYALLLLLLTCAAQWKIHRTEWVNHEEME